MRKPVTRQMIANHLKSIKIGNTNCKIPFEAGEGIPLELDPTMGRKLPKETLDLAPA